MGESILTLHFDMQFDFDGSYLTEILAPNSELGEVIWTESCEEYLFQTRGLQGTASGGNSFMPWDWKKNRAFLASFWIFYRDTLEYNTREDFLMNLVLLVT